MSHARNVLALASVFLVVLLGCQDAETPVGIVNQTDNPVADTNENSNVPENIVVQDTIEIDASADALPVPVTAPETVSDPPKPEPQQLVAAKITPPAAEAPQENPVAEPEPLTIGDPAPPLAIATWVTGDPFESFEPGQVSVVEFWATWCGPCKTSMPHLSQLNIDYGDQVQVIGVTREDAGVVEKFLDKNQSAEQTWRDVVSYRLAADDESITSTAYMKAAGQAGIPTAFIVGRDGIIEWIGHPMSMDASLASVVAGDHDRATALAEYKKSQQLKQLSRQLNLFLRSKDYDKALIALSDLEETSGKSTNIRLMRLTILNLAGQQEEAAALQTTLIEEVWDNSRILNQLAWNIAIGRAPRDLDLALKAATQACELTQYQDGSILDTLARVCFELGDIDQAISWQKQAVKYADGKESIQKTLEQYETEKSDKESLETGAESAGGQSENKPLDE